MPEAQAPTSLDNLTTVYLEHWVLGGECRMIYVVYHRPSVFSGRALREALQEIKKGGARGGFPKFYAKHLRGQKPELIVNLGTTEPLGEGLRILNSREMVRAAANKKAARNTFAAKEVPAPIFYPTAQAVTQAALPVIGRTSYHSKGRGFWFCATLDEVRRASAAGATHFLQFIPNTREYRVHLFAKTPSLVKPQDGRAPEDYRSIKISEKVWVGEGEPPKNRHQKNHEFGWTFLGQQNRRPEELNLVRSAAKSAAAALGMDFGAVDVMYSVLMKSAYVLEINSTPSLADENADTCERYAKRILKIAEGQDTPED
jgi:hypothetical protein